MVYQAPKMEITCKSYALEKLMYPNHLKAHKVFGISSSRLMLKVFLPLLFILKSLFSSLDYSLMSGHSRHMSSHR